MTVTPAVQVHDLSVGEPDPSAPVVIAVHGITANALSWLCVAEELGRRYGPGSVRLLAPDLRGRACSRAVSGPFGLGVHADDMLDLVDSVGGRATLVGHSMGAYVTALASARAPQKVAGSVLVDGGFAFPAPPGLDVDAALAAIIGPAMTRLSMRFEGPEAYLALWSDHPAVGPALSGPQGSEAREYVLHDLVQSPEGDWVSSCVVDAIRADGADVLVDKETHNAAVKAAAAGVSTEFLWAARGFVNDPPGLYGKERIEALQLPDAIAVSEIPDVNHYTAALSPQGASVIVDAIERHL